jgi:hypothetical protein
LRTVDEPDGTVAVIPLDDPARIDLALDSRSISFENPTGARGAGGTSAGGRKGGKMGTFQISVILAVNPEMPHRFHTVTFEFDVTEI